MLGDHLALAGVKLRLLVMGRLLLAMQSLLLAVERQPLLEVGQHFCNGKPRAHLQLPSHCSQVCRQRDLSLWSRNRTCHAPSDTVRHRSRESAIRGNGPDVRPRQPSHVFPYRYVVSSSLDSLSPRRDFVAEGEKFIASTAFVAPTSGGDVALSPRFATRRQGGAAISRSVATLYGFDETHQEGDVSM